MTATPRASAAAFAPGHVTGFFEIHDAPDELARRGSRGAGFCLSSGAVSYVEIEPADSLDLRIAIDREEQDAPVTRDALTRLLKLAVRDAKVPLNKDAPRGQRAKIAVRVHTDLHLPVSQGFGMSAAGALSAAFALAKCLRMGRSEAILAAHEADVSLKGGLGDVAGATHGGFEARVTPGIAPYGSLRSFVGYGEVVLCVLDGPLETKSVLSDPVRRAAINEAGKRAVDAFLKAPTMDAFLDHAQRFAVESGLATPRIRDAMEACRPHGRASMSMLGNSVFAFGNVKRLAETLEPFGETRVSPISEAGARLLEVRDASGA